ncbi:MAG TPA: hypothetical protein VN860_04645 [Candidatus Acidoferrales bacterium]|nr:hypothetical protein [Candidatus Acidoferrales bacterium]
MSTVIILLVFAGLLLIVARQSNLTQRAAFKSNPNANGPDVFASEDADLDPESDTGEPNGWN